MNFSFALCLIFFKSCIQTRAQSSTVFILPCSILGSFCIKLDRGAGFMFAQLVTSQTEFIKSWLLW